MNKLSLCVTKKTVRIFFLFVLLLFTSCDLQTSIDLFDSNNKKTFRSRDSEISNSYFYGDRRESTQNGDPIIGEEITENYKINVGTVPAFESFLELSNVVEQNQTYLGNEVKNYDMTREPITIININDDTNNSVSGLSASDFTYLDNWNNNNLKPVVTYLDLNNDGIKEKYHFYSFLRDNNFKNNVTRVTSQRGGTCVTHSHVGAMEIVLSRKLSEQRPITQDHTGDDFSPVALSNGWYMGANEPTDEVTNITKWHGTTLLNHMFDSEYEWPGKAKWSNQMAYALEKRFSKVSKKCEQISSLVTEEEFALLEEQNKTEAELTSSKNNKALLDYNEIWDKSFKPIRDCMWSVAKKEKMPFVSISPTKSIDVACNDFTTGGYKCDYLATDYEIASAIIHGYPVLTIAHWKWDEAKTRMFALNNQYYDFKQIFPSPLESYHPEKGDGNVQINGKKYYFGTNHSVVIMGIFLPTNKLNGVPSYLIKNSHDDHTVYPNKTRKDGFLIVSMPSNFNSVTEKDSTQRNFYLEGYSARFTPVKDVKLTKFDSSVNDYLDVIDKDLDNQDGLLNNDKDNDGVPDYVDNCPDVANGLQLDSDKDFVGDECDKCKNMYDRYQDKSNIYAYGVDLDEDGIPKLCDNKDDSVGMTALGLIDKSPKINNYNFLSGQYYNYEFGSNYSPKSMNFVFEPVVNMTKDIVNVYSEDGSKSFVYALSNQGITTSGNFYGDNKSEFVYTNMASLIIAGYKGGKLVMYKDLYYNDKPDGISLEKADEISVTGDFDSDGRDEMLFKNSIGIQLVGANKTTNEWTLYNKYNFGEWLDKWLLDKKDKIIGGGDFDGDGSVEFIIKNNKSIAIVKKAKDGKLFIVDTVHSYQTKFSKLFENNLNKVSTVGDINGDKREEIIVEIPIKDSLLNCYDLYAGNETQQTECKILYNNASYYYTNNNAHFAILSLSAENQIQVNYLNIGDELGNWIIGKDDKIVTLGNFSGNANGKKEILIRNNSEMGIISTNGGYNNSLSLITAVSSKEQIGKWIYSSYDKIAGVGAFKVKGKDCILIMNKTGVGILELNFKKEFSLVFKTNFNQKLNDWILRAENQILAIDDFETVGIDSILLKSQ